MKSAVLISLSCAVIAGLAPPEAGARSWRFNKIADTDTPIPGGTGTFNLLQAPSYDSGQAFDLPIAVFNGGRFVEGEQAQEGIYTYREGRGLQMLVNRGTPIPGSTGTFTSFGMNPTIDGPTVVFRGCGDVSGCGASPVQEGIYRMGAEGGGLRVVADTHTPVPGGSGNFRKFGPSSVQHHTSAITFVASGSGSQGVYTSFFEGLQLVADTQTAVPRGTGYFTGFGPIQAQPDGLVSAAFTIKVTGVPNMT
jgi:hypothetical protein